MTKKYFLKMNKSAHFALRLYSEKSYWKMENVLSSSHGEKISRLFKLAQ